MSCCYCTNWSIIHRETCLVLSDSYCDQCHRLTFIFKNQPESSDEHSDDEEPNSPLSPNSPDLSEEDSDHEDSDEEASTQTEKRKRTFELEEDCPVCFEQDNMGHSMCLSCNNSCCNLCWSKVDTCPLCRSSK